MTGESRVTNHQSRRSGSRSHTRLRAHILRDAGRDLFVARGLHRVRRPALGGRPQCGGIAKHLGEWDQRPYDADRPLLLDTFDAAPARVQIADHVAHVLLLDLDARPACPRLQNNLGMAILAPAAGLPDVAPLGLRALANGFLVCDLRPADVGLHAELPQHAVDNDLQVQLAHAGDQGLTSFLVETDLERGVFLGQLGQRGTELLLVGLRLGFDGHGNDRFGELHRFQYDGMVLVAQGVAGRRVAQADGGDYVAGGGLRNVLPVVGMHLQDTADPFLLAFIRIVDIGPRGEGSGVHTEVGQLADIGVCDDLEGERGEGFVRIRTALRRCPLPGRIAPFHSVLVHRGRQVIDDGIQQRLHALLADQVDDTLEAVLSPDRQLNGYGIRAETLADHADGAEEVRPRAVHLVDVEDAGDAIAVRLPPDRLRLRLDALNRAHHDDRAVQDAQRSFHLDGKVDVAGRIDDVDAMVAPDAGGGGGGDGDAPLAFLHHPVHRRRAFVHLADPVHPSRVEQDALGRRRLARVDVGDDADVPNFVERYGLRHARSLRVCLTTGNAQTPCSLQPCGAYPRASSLHRPARRRHPGPPRSAW